MFKIFKKNHIKYYLMILPAFIVILIVAIYPLYMSFKLSFSEYSLLSPNSPILFEGFDNFKRMFNSSDFINSISVTFRLTFFVLLIDLIVGCITAAVLNKKFKFNNIVKTIVLLPLLMSPIATGLIWKLMYNYQYGIINYIVRIIGLNGLNWLGMESTALGSIVVAVCWKSIPFVALLMLAGLKSLPGNLYEAAKIDGASKFQMTRYITIPLIMPVFMIILIIRTMDTLRIYDQVWALTAGGPGTSTEVASLFAYKQAFEFFQIGQGAATSVLLFLITGVISIFYLRILWRRS